MFFDQQTGERHPRVIVTDTRKFPYEVFYAGLQSEPEPGSPSCFLTHEEHAALHHTSHLACEYLKMTNLAGLAYGRENGYVQLVSPLLSQEQTTRILRGLVTSLRTFRKFKRKLIVQHPWLAT